MSSSTMWRSREIVEQLVIQADLELLEPAHLGGDTGYGGEAVLLRDPTSGNPFLPGTTLAGALRAYWRERCGYGASARDTALWGPSQGSDDESASQSHLIVDDAPLYAAAGTEVREHVAINGKTRTAQDDKLFDIEVIQAGAKFALSLQLQLTGTVDERQELCRGLAIAAQGLENAEIPLGMQSNRGMGQCEVKGWRVTRYDLANTAHVLAWIALDHPDWVGDDRQPVERTGASLAALLGASPDELADGRDRCQITVTLDLVDGMLIRAGVSAADTGVDAGHLSRKLHKQKPDQQPAEQPVLAGTSLAGSMRARALKITQTLPHVEGKPQTIIDKLFGYGPASSTEQGQASRLTVREAAIEGGQTLVQRRIKIDRFTGGVLDGALFEEEPHFGGSTQIKVAIRSPEDFEIGLLLQVVKDLWNEDLPIGGTSAIGRGRLRGRGATLERWQGGAHARWAIEARDGKLVVRGTRTASKSAAPIALDQAAATTELNAFAAALMTELSHDEEADHDA